MVINGKIYNFIEEERIYNKAGMKKWYKSAEPFTSYIYIKYNKNTTIDYNKSELNKLINYNDVTDIIIDTILNNINTRVPTKIGIESYSYNSANGAIIDLVTFSTLLRNKLYYKVSNDILIIPPKSLKLLSAKMTYVPEITGVRKKKYTYRNNEGIAGGSFTKKEIYKSLLENTDLCGNKYVEYLRSNIDILELAAVPKPIDDNNDAFTLYWLIKNNYCNA